MAALGEITIVFETDDLKNGEEARKHLHKDLLAYFVSEAGLLSGLKVRLKALDVTHLEIYDDVDEIA